MSLQVRFLGEFETPKRHFEINWPLVGTSGIIPLILIPQTAQDNKTSTNKENEEKTTQEKKTLNRQLSFAVGGLLGDVFLHLLPESYENGKDFYLSNIYRKFLEVHICLFNLSPCSIGLKIFFLYELSKWFLRYIFLIEAKIRRASGCNQYLIIY